MIVLFAMPPDRARADAVVDALVDADLTVWGEDAVPGSAEWDAAIAKAADARCLIFCWSEAALDDTPEATAFRQAATDVCAQGRTIGVLFQDVAPPSGFACTLYALHGWRAEPTGWRKWLIGDAHMRDIVAAAKSKQANRDPAPPSAPRKLLMRQAAAAFSAVVLPIVGVLSFSELAMNVSGRIAAQPSAEEEAAWTSLPAGSCEALRSFVAAHPDGAYRDEADALIGAARRSEVTVWEAQVLEDEIYLPHSGSGLDPAGEAQSRCAMLVQGTGARLTSATPEAMRETCETVGSEQMCDWRGKAVCAFEQPVTEIREVCGSPLN